MAGLLVCMALSVFGWGAGHEDHVRLVLQYLPSEISEQWNPEQRKNLEQVWSHFPDSIRKLEDNRKFVDSIPPEDLSFLRDAGFRIQYHFHNPNGQAAAFYLLVKAFREKRAESSALYAGILLHSLADAAAVNHGPLIHHYTYTQYQHVRKPLNPVRLDLSWMRKNPELRTMIAERLRKMEVQPSRKTLSEAFSSLLDSSEEAAGFMCSVEHKLAGEPSESMEAMADLAVCQTRDGVRWIVQAWNLANAGIPLNCGAEMFSAKGQLAAAAESRRRARTPRDPALDGIYDGLFVPVEDPAIGVVCEATSVMGSARLGFGARFLSAVCARSLRTLGWRIRMISLDSLQTPLPGPEKLPVLLVCSSGALPKFAERTIRQYTKSGGRLIFIGGKDDSNLTGMQSLFIRKSDSEVPVTSKYGKGNEELFRKMTVIRHSDRKSFRFKDNPNCPAGWNKPFSNIAIRRDGSLTPLFDLENGTERFCIAASNGTAVWIPQYLLMPFLFSEETGMNDWVHPELDSFGTEVLKIALSSFKPEIRK